MVTLPEGVTVDNLSTITALPPELLAKIFDILLDDPDMKEQEDLLKTVKTRRDVWKGLKALSESCRKLRSPCIAAMFSEFTWKLWQDNWEEIPDIIWFVVR